MQTAGLRKSDPTGGAKVQTLLRGRYGGGDEKPQQEGGQHREANPPHEGLMVPRKLSRTPDVQIVSSGFKFCFQKPKD